MNSSFTVFFSHNLIVFNKFTYLCNNVPWPSFRSTKRIPRGEHAIKDLYIYVKRICLFYLKFFSVKHDSIMIFYI